MTPADRQAMVAAWKAIHKGVRPDCFPSVTHTGEKMFSAGLAHARSEREASAAEIERLTAERDAAISAAVDSEREACAAVCEKSSFPAFTAKCFAADIRARAKP